MRTIYYPAIFHPENPGYSITVHDLRNCFTQGETVEEGITMAQDALSLMLEDYESFPVPSKPSALHVDTGDFVVMIPFYADYPTPYLSALHREAEETKAEIAAGKHPVYTSAEEMLHAAEKQ